MSYTKYLEQQLKLSSKKENMASYHKYIIKEIVRNNKKIESVKAKME